MSRLWGGIDAGGTGFKCLIATGPDQIVAESAVPTTSPEETLAAVRAVFERFGPSRLAGIGVACFGPVDVREGSPGHGRILTTPKPGWSGVDVLGALRPLGVPLVIDTDVNAAARAERVWGAGRGVTVVAYLTVGTGIGLGFAGGPQGLMHAEAGHILPRRHPQDEFAGVCPFHGDCIEGLASGPAMRARWGAPAETLEASHRAWEIESWYLAQAVASALLVGAADRVVIGGGVGTSPGLVERVRQDVARLIGDYRAVLEPRGGLDVVVASAGLGLRAGVLGAIRTAQEVLPPMRAAPA